MLHLITKNGRKQLIAVYDYEKEVTLYVTDEKGHEYELSVLLQCDYYKSEQSVGIISDYWECLGYDVKKAAIWIDHKDQFCTIPVQWLDQNKLDKLLDAAIDKHIETLPVKGY